MRPPRKRTDAVDGKTVEDVMEELIQADLDYGDYGKDSGGLTLPERRDRTYLDSVRWRAEQELGLCTCDRVWKNRPRPEGVHLNGCPKNPQPRQVVVAQDDPPRRDGR
jgi:hypothetical protein